MKTNNKATTPPGLTKPKEQAVRVLEDMARQERATTASTRGNGRERLVSEAKHEAYCEALSVIRSLIPDN